MKPALVVDLDGTLLRSDMTHESLLRAVLRRPLGVFRALLALPQGRAAVKARLARLARPDVDRLPYRSEILSEIDAAKAEGRQIALVSASDQHLVEVVADHLGCFDHLAGSDGAVNLGGQAKADHLVARYGRGGYSYAGDAWRDLPVWAAGCEAVTVAAGPGLRRAAEAAAVRCRHVAPPTTRWSLIATYLRQLRPHLWLRNAFVFLPVIAAGSFDVADWLRALAAFAAMCLAAASVYTINDLVDLDADRLHSRKSNRPLARGDLPLSHGVAMVLGLAAAAAAVALLYATHALLAVLGAYVGLSLVYMAWFKRRRWLDLGALGVLSMFRPIAGAAATGLAMSPALVAAVGFACLTLAGANRLVELLQARRSGQWQVLGREYGADDIPGVMGLSLGTSVLGAAFIAAYALNADALASHVEVTLLVLVAPIVLYWLCHMVLCARRGVMTEDTVIFAVRDPVSLACGAGVVVSMVAAIAA